MPRSNSTCDKSELRYSTTLIEVTTHVASNINSQKITIDVIGVLVHRYT